jgi:hypothetical protein
MHRPVRPAPVRNRTCNSRPPRFSRVSASLISWIPRPWSRRGRRVRNPDKGIIDNIFPGGNSPFQPTVTVNNVSVDNPGASLQLHHQPPITVTTLNKNLTPPTRWNWNFTVEQQLPRHSSCPSPMWGLAVCIIGRVFDINQPTAGALHQQSGSKNVNYLRPYQGYASDSARAKRQ